MKTLPPTCAPAARQLLRLASAALLIVTAGCGYKIEQDGDLNPILGEYRVTVNPSSQDVVILPGTETIKYLQVSLDVSCFGFTLLEDCDSVAPHWSVFSPSPYLDAGINNELARDTIGWIEIKTEAFPFHAHIDSLYGAREQEVITFRPDFIPKGLWLSGSGRVTLNISDPSLAPDRQAQPADAPFLRAFPRSLVMQSTGPAQEDVKLYYTGPDTTADIIVSGEDPGAFTVPPSVALRNGKSSSLTIKWMGPIDGSDWATYNCRVQILVPYGNAVTITVRASR